MSDAPTPDGETTSSEFPSLKLIAAVTAAWSFGQLSYYAQAQLLGPIMNGLGADEEAIGWLFSFENGALALAILSAAGPLGRLSRSRVALFGGAVLVVANILSAFATGYEMLVMSRVMAGIGAGFVGAAGTAAAASSLSPERVFAIVTVTWGVAASIAPAIFPFLTVPYGAPGGFLLMAGIGLLLMPLFGWLLPPREDPDEKPSLLTAPNRTLALIAMFALVVYEIGQAGVYTFIAQIGDRSGLDEYQVGFTLSATGLAGLIGGVFAAWLGMRVGRNGPIMIGVALNIVAACGLALFEDTTSYVILNWLWNAAYYFVVPYLMGALAAMDDLGRWVVASDGAWWLGDALAPGIAGTLVTQGGHTPLAGLSLVTGLTCIVVMMGVLNRLRRVLADSS